MIVSTKSCSAAVLGHPIEFTPTTRKPNGFGGRAYDVDTRFRVVRSHHKTGRATFGSTTTVCSGINRLQVYDTV